MFGKKKKARNHVFLSYCARFVCFVMMHDRMKISLKLR
jgi:hypothetical protein